MAQLGARFHGMEEVVGSIPTRSTKSLNALAAARCRSGRSLTCDSVPVITALCHLNEPRLKLFQRRPFSRVPSVRVHIHRHPGVCVTKDSLCRFRVHFLIYDQHGSQ